MLNAILLDCGAAVLKQLKPLLADRGYRVLLEATESPRPEGSSIVVVGPSPAQAARVHEVSLSARYDTGIIALTSPATDHPERLVRAGADDILQLPASDADLTRMLDLAEARTAARMTLATSRPGSPLESMLLDQVKAAVIVTEPRGRIVYWNRFAEQLYGWTREEALGRDIDRVTPAGMSQVQAAEIMDRLRSGEAWEGEFTVRRKDGTEFVAHVVDAPLRDSSGELIGVVGVSSDMTALRTARAEAERLNSLLAHVVGAASTWVGIIDLEGNYTYTNRAGEEITGFSEAELLTMNFRDVVAPGHQARTAAMIEASVGSRDPATGVIVEIVRRDGARRTLRVSVGPLVQDGDVVAVVGTAEDVTDEMRQVRDLQRLALIYEHISDAVIVSDLDRLIVDMNPAAERLTGYARDEALGMPTTKLLRAEDADRIAREARTGVESEGAWQGEAVFVRKDGTLGVCETVTAALYDESRVAIGRVAVHRDVTQRRMMEAAEREAEAFRAWVMESVSEAIFALDFDGHVTLANGRAEQLVARPMEELLGQHFSAFLQPAAAEDLARTYVELVGQGAESVQYETDIVRPDGSSRRVLFTAAPLRRDGEFVGVVGTGEDITDRVAHQNLIRESESRFRALAEAAFDGVIVCRDAVIIEANDAAARMFGYEPPELPGMSSFALHPDDARPLVQARRRGGNQAPYEVLGLRKDGSTFPVELVGRDCDFQGQPARITAMRDLTERKRAAEALARAEKLESLGVLAAGIAHDFNNILVGILGNAGVARRELLPGSVAREALGEIEFAANRAADLARSMLAYSGTATVALEPVDVGAAAEEMLQLARTTVASAASANLELQSGLPRVVADPGQVRQVLFNLILNALEAVADSGGTVEITTSLHKPGAPLPDGAALVGPEPDPTMPYVAVTVSDDGPGMAPEVREKIFDPFFTTKFTGRGLGLASVLGIVSAHSGAIAIQTSPGAGTALTVLLPADTAAAADRRAPSTVPAGWRGSGTVLVVDDDDGVRAVTRRALEQMGFRVVLAADGVEGVERFKAEADVIVCVLLDMTMPRLDGARTSEAIREIHPDVPVVLMSGYTEQEARERFTGAEITAFLQKPYPVENLRALLASLVG